MSNGCSNGLDKLVWDQGRSPNTYNQEITQCCSKLVCKIENCSNILVYDNNNKFPPKYDNKLKIKGYNVSKIEIELQPFSIVK